MFVPEGIIGKMAKWFRVYRTHSLDNMLAGTCAVSEWASRCPKIIIIHFASLLYPRFIKFILISPEVKISTTYDTIFDSHDLAR